MGTEDRLLSTADIHTWAQKTSYCRLLKCTWAQKTGYCRLLTFIHGHRRQAIVDCWHVYLGAEDKLLSTADVYMGADDRLLSTADMCTWAQNTGCCRLLTCVHGHRRQAAVDCWHVYMGTEDRLLSTADICIQQTGWSYVYTAAHVLKAQCLIEHNVNMTLAKVMNKLLMTNLVKFVPLNLRIQNKYLYGSDQYSFILFNSYTFQSKSAIIRL